MDTLGTLAEKKIKTRMAKPYNLRPFTTLDNIDIQAQAQNSRIESSTKLLHGLYGYLHFLPAHLIEDMDPNKATAENLLRCSKKSQSESFDIHSILPYQTGTNNWTFVLKAQLSSALLNHAVEPNPLAYKTCKS